MKGDVLLQVASILEILLPGSILAIVLGFFALLGQFFGVIDFTILDKILGIINKVIGIRGDDSDKKTGDVRESTTDTDDRTIDADGDVTYVENHIDIYLGGESAKEESKEALKEALKEAIQPDSPEGAINEDKMAKKFKTEVDSASDDDLQQDAETEEVSTDEED